VSDSQWVVGNLHHEDKPPHHIDRDFDLVRIQGVKNMRAHCSIQRWAFHPGAKGDYGTKAPEKNYSGFIARISLEHAPGCDEG
jgi:hypothetical protein